MRTDRELAPTIDELSQTQRAYRIWAQCDRLAYHAGFTVPDPQVEEPTQRVTRPSLLVVQDRDASGSAPTRPDLLVPSASVHQAWAQLVVAVKARIWQLLPLRHD